MKVSMKAWLNLLFVSILLQHYRHVEGTLSISPSGVAPVCSGDQLELMCNTTGRLLEWSFFMINDETGVAREYAGRGISADGPREAQTSTQTRFNSTVITFSRNSDQNSPVLTSRVLIGGLSDDLNGTVVTCMDVASETMVSTTVITQFNNLSQDRLEVNVSEQFENHIVTVSLEWIQTNTLYSYYINVFPQILVIFNGSTSAMLSMSYNIPYNVSVLGADICGENFTIFTRSFHFINCGNPKTDTTDENNTTVSGSISPAVNARSTVDITICPPGLYTKDKNNNIIMQQNVRLSIILGSSFGVIACLVIIITVILTLAYLTKTKTKGSKEANTSENQYECYSMNGDQEVRTTSGDQNNSKIATDGIVYADIGPSSFVHLSHQRPTIDDGAIEYAQIKHNPSVSQKIQPVVKESLTESKSRSDKLAVNLDNLLIQLRPQVAPKWYQFGEAAGIDKETLDRFINQCSPEDCIMEMLDCWLRKYVKQPTWLDVAKILNSIELPQLAMEIENIYVTGDLFQLVGKFPVAGDMDWVPQMQVVGFFNSKSAITESPPPPIPPKLTLLESKVPSNQLDHDSTSTLPPLSL